MATNDISKSVDISISASEMKSFLVRRQRQIEDSVDVQRFYDRHLHPCLSVLLSSWAHNGLPPGPYTMTLTIESLVVRK